MSGFCLCNRWHKPLCQGTILAGQRVNGSAVKEPDSVFDELSKSIVFVYVFISIESS